MLHSTDVARDILLLDAAANDVEADEQVAAAAAAAAERLVVWAKAQLKNKRAGEAVAEATADKRTLLAMEEWPEPALLPRADPEDWAFRRRSGAFHKNQCGSGFAQGSADALKQMRSLTMVCCRSECDALVDYKVARRQAKQAKRSHFEPGDGCAGPLCSEDHRPPRFAKRQCKYAAELVSNERLLVRWPHDCADREVWIWPEVAARSAAALACKAVE